MSGVLSEHLQLLITAAGGIQKLRGLILELALRGKLVPQDPEDEPASELLKRAEQEWRRLQDIGVRKKNKVVPIPDVEIAPPELPDGWVLTDLATIALINPRNTADDSMEVSFVPMAMIGNRFDGSHKQEFRKWSDVKQGFTHFAEGDVGVAKITPCFENSKACVFVGLKNGIGAGTTELYIIRPMAQTLVPRYVLAYLKAPMFLAVGETKMTGTAGQKRLPKDFLESNPFPLPPLAEQQRIVAKVDELMALCDQLEAEQANAESSQAKLVESLLGTLTQSINAADFAANWQRLARQFDTLFTTESSLDALKQAILQLAVMGKLVSQNPDDEPAGELLKRIRGSRKVKRKISAIDTESLEIPLPNIPDNWEWTVVDQIASDTDSSITDGPFGANLKTEHYISSPGNRVIRLQNIAKREFRAEHHAYIDSERFARLEKHHVFAGDLVVAGLIDDSIRCCKLPSDIGNALVKADCYRFSVHECISTDFSLNYLNSPLASLFAASHHHGMTLTRIGLGNFRQLPFPLPPIAEQHRIVDKVNELLTLCDNLKASIIESSFRQEQLASSLIDAARKAA